eukprot:TRINITY_DN12278_c0_g1_i1.p1 TRINITY_DN12278_c0_g1~~TRINITY_DN12278_c0_g1_i1.p1  ORF type:complete len:648 (+),score=129.82 TRINITY_DN12278_c0_g1_i1:34-1944(+)
MAATFSLSRPLFLSHRPLLLLILLSLFSLCLSVPASASAKLSSPPYSAPRLQEAELNNPLSEAIRTFSRNAREGSKLWQAMQKRHVENHPDGIIPLITYLEMDDGVELFTNYWSIGSKKRPTVLIRSPYGPTSEDLALLFLPYGFNAVMQNARGTGFSGGSWSFFSHDWHDGHTTMEWIANQHWSNGDVYELGVSADGFLDVFQSKIDQPHLKGQSLIWTSGLPFLAAFQNNGAFRDEMTSLWLDLMQVSRPWIPKNTYLNTTLKHEGWDDFWALRSLQTEEFKRIKWPAFHMLGWYDIFTGPQWELFNNYNTLSDPSAQGKQQMVVGPRGHGSVSPRGSWKNWYPGEHKAEAWALDQSVKRFNDFAHWNEEELALKDELIDELEMYTLYVCGASDYFASKPPKGLGQYWTTIPSLPKVTPVTLYLHSLNQLGSNPATSKFPYEYVYDPRSPVPTLCGNNLFLAAGPCDQRKAEARDDVVLFDTDAFPGPVTVLGKISVDLFVSSNCTDTDFTIKVTDVYPSGESILITDNILRMRWKDEVREGTQTAKPIVPGQVYQVTIESWPILQVFEPGHKLRLAISSSNYPRFSTNLNNGNNVLEGGDPIVAVNRVFVGGQTNSKITLPTVNLSDLPRNVT